MLLDIFMLDWCDVDLSARAGDYHAYTDTREQMQQRVDEGSAASSTRSTRPSAAEAFPEAESSDSLEEVCWAHAAVLMLTYHSLTTVPVIAELSGRPGLQSNSHFWVQDMFKEDLPRPSTTTSVDSLQTRPPQQLDAGGSARDAEGGAGAVQSNPASSALNAQQQAQLLSTAPAANSGPITERACALVS